MGFDICLYKSDAATIVSADKMMVIGSWHNPYAVFNWFEKSLASVDIQPQPDNGDYVNYIVENQLYEVEQCELNKLLADCQNVLNISKRKELTADDVGYLVPICDLCRLDFGISYISEIETTIKIIEYALLYTNWDKERVYLYSFGD